MFYKQNTKCTCGHALLVHLVRCSIKGCSCKRFTELKETKVATSVEVELYAGPCNIKYNNSSVRVIASRYVNNQRIALELEDLETGEPVAIASTNLAHQELANDEVFIKSYGENEGMEEFLIDAGIIEEYPASFARSGFVRIPRYKLTKAALAKLHELK